MTFEEFYSIHYNNVDKVTQEKEILDEYNIELSDSVIKINENYIKDSNQYEVFLCIVDNKYTKCVSNLLNKKFNDKEEPTVYFNELKSIDTIEKLDERL